MCPQCSAFVSVDDRVCPYCQRELSPRRITQAPSGDIFGGLIPQARFVTVMVLLVNTALYVAMTVLSMRSGNEEAFTNLDGQTLLAFGAKYGPAIALGQWWRLLTAGFLHGGIIHILMNSWVLFDVGATVEEEYGTSRLIVIYVFSTITGFLASLYWAPVALSTGSSSAIFGLIGAMIALGTRSSGSMGAMMRGFYIRWAIFGLVLGLMPGVDNAAHLGGIAGGFVVGFLAGTPGLLNDWREKFWRAACGFCLALTGYCFLRMFLQLLAPSE
jgi:rhomboid protease GluP